MYILNSNFIFNVELNELFPEKMNKIISEFKKEFPEIHNQKDTYILKNGANVFIMAPTQISYGYHGNMAGLDFESLGKNLIKISEILGVELKFRSRIILNATSVRDAADAFKESKDYLSEFKQEGDIQGIGYRFMINNDEYVGDIKIEPFVKDPSQIYYELIIDSKDDGIVIADIAYKIERLFSETVSRAKSIGEKIFKS